MDDTTREMLALLVVIGLGLAIGRVSWRGISLGAAGVLFVALLAGQFGFQVPQLAGTVGVVLFVYCLGIGAGPGFLQSLARQGKSLAVLGTAMILAAAASAWCVARWLGLGADLAAGLFAGSLTSTPALASAAERLPADSDVALGFGVAYPVGVVGVILFVQFARLFFAREADDRRGAEGPADGGGIARVLVDVVNPAVVGRRLRDVRMLAHANCQVSRVLVGVTMTPIPADFTLQLRQRLLVVGDVSRIGDVVETLGQPVEETDFVLDAERQRRRVVVTSKELIGRSLAELHLLSRFGVTVARINRHDVEFVPGSAERIQFGDALTVVSDPDALQRFIKYAGHRERTIDETDLISLVAALALGVIVGQLRFDLGGRSISLGMAGGPLLVGLLMGHFGRIGPFVGHMPRAARFLLSELGLALFLAASGARAGANLLPVVREHGPALFAGAVVILCVPLIAGFLVAHWGLKMKPLESLGGICGAMTSTPALGLIASAVESSLPITSYATVYPLALILITLMAPLLIELI